MVNPSPASYLRAINCFRAISKAHRFSSDVKSVYFYLLEKPSTNSILSVSNHLGFDLSYSNSIINLLQENGLIFINVPEKVVEICCHECEIKSINCLSRCDLKFPESN